MGEVVEVVEGDIDIGDLVEATMVEVVSEIFFCTVFVSAKVGLPMISFIGCFDHLIF